MLGLPAWAQHATSSIRQTSLSTHLRPSKRDDDDDDSTHAPGHRSARLTSMAIKFNPSSAAKCTVTPPSLNRQHSYFTRHDGGRSDATTSLANVASRTTSPRRQHSSGSSQSSSMSSPADSISSEHRTSWEDCRLQRDGYISFPDFDQLRALHGGDST